MLFNFLLLFLELSFPNILPRISLLFLFSLAAFLFLSFSSSSSAIYWLVITRALRAPLLSPGSLPGGTWKTSISLCGINPDLTSGWSSTGSVSDLMLSTCCIKYNHVEYTGFLLLVFPVASSSMYFWCFLRVSASSTAFIAWCGHGWGSSLLASRITSASAGIWEDVTMPTSMVNSPVACSMGPPRPSSKLLLSWLVSVCFPCDDFSQHWPDSGLFTCSMITLLFNGNIPHARNASIMVPGWKVLRNTSMIILTCSIHALTCDFMTR